MARVSASSTILIDAEPGVVLNAVADYRVTRPKILSPHYSHYQVLQGGHGEGTVASWQLQATQSRSREVRAAVDIAGRTVAAPGEPCTRAAPAPGGNRNGASGSHRVTLQATPPGPGGRDLAPRDGKGYL